MILASALQGYAASTAASKYDVVDWTTSPFVHVRELSSTQKGEGSEAALAAWLRSAGATVASAQTDQYDLLVDTDKVEVKSSMVRVVSQTKGKPVQLGWSLDAVAPAKFDYLLGLLIDVRRLLVVKFTAAEALTHVNKRGSLRLYARVGSGCPIEKVWWTRYIIHKEIV